MALEKGGRWLGAIHGVFSSPDITARGVRFMDSMISHLTAVNQNSPNLGSHYPDTSEWHPLVNEFLNNGIREYSWQPHRMWIDGDYNHPENEVEFSMAMRYTYSGELRVVCNFQSEAMKQNGNSYFLILDKNSNSPANITYIGFQKDSNNGINVQGQKIHKLTREETLECIKLMKKMEEAHKGDIDSSPYSGTNNRGDNLLKISYAVELSLEKQIGMLGLNEVEREFVQYIRQKDPTN